MNVVPRFVVLAHDWPIPHFDLMLEVGPSLMTWRLNQLPEVGKTITAERIENHRLEYLDFEGPVSGGRGTVMRCDEGTYEWVEDDPTHYPRVTLYGLICPTTATWDPFERQWMFDSI